MAFICSSVVVRKSAVARATSASDTRRLAGVTQPFLLLAYAFERFAMLVAHFTRLLGQPSESFGLGSR